MSVLPIVRQDTDSNRSYQDNMPSCTRYTKEQLLDMLQEQCPDVINKLPSPDTFSFRRNSKGKHELSVGSTHGLVRRGERELWVICGGTAKPHLYFRSNVNSSGLFSKNVGQEGFIGNSFFSKMPKRKMLNPFSEPLKAVVGFVFVYCGKKEEFIDFGLGNGFQILVKELKYMMARDDDRAGEGIIPEVARADTAEVLNANAVKDHGDNYSKEEHSAEVLPESSENVLSEHSKKRALSVDTDEHSVEKKLRVE